MNILVTGCAGFIGSHLVEMLCLQGWNVVGIDDFSNGTPDNMMQFPRDKFSFIKGDVRDLDAYRGPDIDVIIHLAALGSVPRSMKFPDLYMQNNVFGFHQVLEFARQRHIKTVFYASSSSVYGNQPKFYRNEEDQALPCSPYAASKAINEIMAETYERAYWITCHGLRFFNVFGPRQRFDSDYAALVPKMCHQILKTGTATIFGDGKQIRTFTPVRFVAEAVTSMVANPHLLKSTIYNVTHADYAASVQDTVNLVGRMLETPYTVVYEQERAGDVKSSVGVGTQLQQALGHLASHYPTLEAVKETCDWYKQRINLT
jgi:UDP-N-acetylglucosamine 4-epimerase